MSTEVQEMSMDEAVSAMLGSPEPQAEPAPAEEPPAEDAPVAEAAPEATPETQEESVAEEVVEIDPDADVFDIEVRTEDGKKEAKKVSLSELQRGYMMQKDYQRKTAELARAKESVTQEVAKQVTEKTSSFTQELEVLAGLVMQHVAPELRGVNWQELAATDPAEYVRLKAKADSVGQTLQTLQAKHAQAKKVSEAESQQQRAKLIEENVTALKKDIPGWNDEVYGDLMKYAIDIGFPAEEVRDWVDARTFKMLHKAKAYDALQAAKPTVEKKVVAVPKVVRPGSAGQAGDAKSEVAAKAMARLKNSGSIDDAVNFLLASKRR